MSLISDNSMEVICPGEDLGQDNASVKPHAWEFFQSYYRADEIPIH